MTIFSGKGDLPAIRIETEWSTAEIYQHGAHVTGIRKMGGAPLLFMSGASDFHHGKPNVGEHAITLAPGEQSSLKVEIDSLPL